MPPASRAESLDIPPVAKLPKDIERSVKWVAARTHWPFRFVTRWAFGGLPKQEPKAFGRASLKSCEGEGIPGLP